MTIRDHILLVEDADSLREVITALLRHEGYRVTPHPSAESALAELANQQFDCVLSDFKLPGMNGIELLTKVRAVNPSVPFVIMTAYGSIDIAVHAMKEGANDFITKPFEPSALSAMIGQVIKHRRIIDRSTGVSTRRDRKLSSADPKVTQLISRANKVARVDTSVLILGESGSGKELLARFIHEQSSRTDEPFLAINCGAIPEELVESELFGHEAGAFTGATQSRAGLFELAHTGTLFLDEVGEISPMIQVKLLRALQEHEITRVGSNDPIPANPRIICATNKNLQEAMERGEIREDFYYRIAVLPLEIPPLRERPKDILALAQQFIQYFSERSNREQPSLDPTAAELLQRYPWPGNIRELENVIERALISAQKVITPADLGLTLKLDLTALDDAALSLTEVAQQAAEKAERELIVQMLARTGGNKSQAARLLGVSYKTLLSKVRGLGIESVSESSEREPQESADSKRR